jgi:hypothetical protein
MIPLLASLSSPGGSCLSSPGRSVSIDQHRWLYLAVVGALALRRVALPFLALGSLQALVL